MNKLDAKIVAIETSDHIALIDLLVEGDTFTCVVIETPETAGYLRIGNGVSILFKETEVSIAKNLSGQISLRNQIHAAIRQIEKGRVLTKITLDYKGAAIGSVITTRSANQLGLKTGDVVIGLIKANEVSIMEANPSWNSVGSL